MCCQCRNKILVFSIANAKTKTQLKLICQIFDFIYESQQNFTIKDDAKSLEGHTNFNGVTRTFSYTQAWVSEGGGSGPDLPIGYIGLSQGPQDPRGPPTNWYA